VVAAWANVLRCQGRWNETADSHKNSVVSTASGDDAMQTLYFCLASFHIVAVIVTGILWTVLDLGYGSRLRRHLRDIRAVHFGSLYLVPWFLGLACAFWKLGVPDWHQAFFPAGLGALVLFAGVAYLFPRPPGLDPFYYWTRGWPMVLSLIGLACLVVALLWTGAVLVIYLSAG
jgi:hypothetical protein